jgi:hypothetical protein
MTARTGPVTSVGAVPWDLMQALQQKMGNWTKATYKASCVGPLWESELVYVTPSGASVRLTGEGVTGDPLEAVDQFAAKRRFESYTPESGPWFSFQLLLTSDGPPVMTEIYGDLPQTQKPIPDLAYQHELRVFPRNDDAIPGWLREKAGLPPAAPAPAAPTAQQGAAPGTPRLAKVFDGFDEATGKPIVNRPKLQDGEAPRILAYLNAGPVVLSANGRGEDAFFPAEHPDLVPLRFATDGTWVWAAAVGWYLEAYGMPLDPEFLAHIRGRNYELGEVSAEGREAARVFLTSDMSRLG